MSYVKQGRKCAGEKEKERKKVVSRIMVMSEVKWESDWGNTTTDANTQNSFLWPPEKNIHCQPHSINIITLLTSHKQPIIITID